MKQRLGGGMILSKVTQPGRGLMGSEPQLSTPNLCHCWKNKKRKIIHDTMEMSKEDVIQRGPLSRARDTALGSCSQGERLGPTCHNVGRWNFPIAKRGVCAWQPPRGKLQGKEGFRVLLNECLLTPEPGARRRAKIYQQKGSCSVMSDSATPWTGSLAGDSLSLSGILWTRTLVWVAVPFCKGSSQPRDRTPGLPHCRWIFYRLSHQGSLQGKFIPYRSWGHSQHRSSGHTGEVKAACRERKDLEHVHLWGPLSGVLGLRPDQPI